VNALFWVALAAAGGLAIALTLSLRANARQRAAVRAVALTDELTGLGNRRDLFETVERELAGREGEKLVLALLDLDGFKQYNDTFGHAAGDALLRRLGGNLAQAVRGHGRAFRLGGDEFCVLIEANDNTAEAIVAAAREALVEVGEGFAVSASCGAVMLPELAEDASEALRLADQAMYARKAGLEGRVEHQTREVLLRILREREPELEDDGTRVVALAEATGRAIGLDPEKLDVLIRAATLHDIGKIAIPQRVLHKPGELDEAEWGLLRKHSVIGERILGAAPAMAPVAKAVRSTHERWDGSGYPDGLEGTEIPLASRIVLICDAYDAMTSERPYGQSRTPEQALAELRRNAGTQFDPHLVEIFCSLCLEDLRRPEAPAQGAA
jgi:two-component system, cell cycle response regulator